MRDYNLEQAVEWLSADPARVDALAADKSLNGKHAAAVVRWALVRMRANRMEHDATRGGWSPSGAPLRQGIRRALGIDDGVSVDDAGLIADVEERIRQARLCHDEHAIARPAVARTDGQPPADWVSRLIAKWEHDLIGYPVQTDERAKVAAAAVRLCIRELRAAAPADDTAAATAPWMVESRDERVDRLTRHVENVADCAGIEIEVREAGPLTGPAPLRRLVRALEGAGMLHDDPADDTAAPDGPSS